MGHRAGVSFQFEPLQNRCADSFVRHSAWLARLRTWLSALRTPRALLSRNHDWLRFAACRLFARKSQIVGRKLRT
jgi:hypothetical protein